MSGSGLDDQLVLDPVQERERLAAHRTMAGLFSVPDEMWERIESLIPVAGRELCKGHRKGRDRIPDRQIMDGIFFVMRTGCQWRALDGTGICSGSTAHRRFQEWEQAGVFDALWAQALRDYDEDVGIDWSWLSIDGSMGKARWEAGKPAETRQIAGSSARSAV